MTVALDVIVVLIVVFTIWRCASKGFIRAVFDMLKFTVSLICAIVFKSGLAKIIIGSGIYATVGEKLKTELSRALSNAGANIGSEEMISAFTNENPEIVKIVEYMGADLDKTRQAIENAVTKGSENISEIAAKHILTPAMESVAHILAFVAIFLASIIILRIAEWILDAVFELPILSSINRVGGVITGIICAVLYASLFVSVTKPVLQNPGIVGGKWDKDVTEKTYVYSYVENHNILSVFID